MTEHLVDRPDQPIHMGAKVAPDVDRGGIEIGEIAQGIGQVGDARHAGAVDEDGDDPRLLPQRAFDLDADRISLILDAARAI